MPVGWALKSCASRDQGQGIREIRGEEAPQFAGALQLGEAGTAVPGQEQGDGETAVQVGQRDQHVAAPRPDMQGMLLHAMAAVRGGGDGEFLVGVGQDVFHHFHAAMAHQRLAHGRAAAVGGDQGGGVDAVTAPARLFHQADVTRVEVHVCAPAGRNGNARRPSPPHP